MKSGCVSEWSINDVKKLVENGLTNAAASCTKHKEHSRNSSGVCGAALEHRGLPALKLPLPNAMARLPVKRLEPRADL